MIPVLDNNGYHTGYVDYTDNLDVSNDVAHTQVDVGTDPHKGLSKLRDDYVLIEWDRWSGMTARTVDKKTAAQEIALSGHLILFETFPDLIPHLLLSG